MLQVMRRIMVTPISNLSRSFSTSNALNSSCDSSEIKEAPILENECVMALPEEAQAKKNLESTITVPYMVNLSPVSGIPTEYLCTRRARIFQPVKNAMQSGVNNIRHWELEFDNRSRWENPLMGWTSSGDPLSFMKLRFSSVCEAVNYCDMNGWVWYIDVLGTEREFRPKLYANNFSWNKRTRVSTK